MLSEQQQRILGYFIEEAKDHLNTIEQGLLNLQSTIEDPEMVSEVFRAAHSVKGGAAMLGLNSIQHTSHRLEDYFKVLKECPVTVDQKLETLFLAVFDALKELLDQLQGPFGLTDDKAAEVMEEVEPTFTALGEHLGFLVSQSGGTPPEEVHLPTPLMMTAVAAPAPQPKPVVEETSALQLIFQSDVPARLRDMLQLFKQADDTNSREQLQAICENLAQVGEQFDMPQWVELLTLSRRAIANPDNSYRTLAPILIKEIKQAQELVLAGRVTEIVAGDALHLLVPFVEAPVEEAGASDDFADLFATADLDSPVTAAEGEEDSLDFEFAAEEDDESLVDIFATDELEEPDLDSSWLEESVDSQAETEDDSLFDLNLGLEEVEASTTPAAPASPDLSLMDGFEEAIPTDEAMADRHGPEVGLSELNSLADLFEGEVPDLGMTWQEEEVIASETVTEVSGSDSNDFSDLLFDQDGLDDLILDTDMGDEDLSGLLNQTELRVDRAGIADVPSEPVLDGLSGSLQSPELPDFLEVEADDLTNSELFAFEPEEELGNFFEGFDSSEIGAESEESADLLFDVDGASLSNLKESPSLDDLPDDFLNAEDPFAELSLDGTIDAQSNEPGSSDSPILEEDLFGLLGDADEEDTGAASLLEEGSATVWVEASDVTAPTPTFEVPQDPWGESTAAMSAVPPTSTPLVAADISSDLWSDDSLENQDLMTQMDEALDFSDAAVEQAATETDDDSLADPFGFDDIDLAGIDESLPLGSVGSLDSVSPDAGISDTSDLASIFDEQLDFEGFTLEEPVEEATAFQSADLDPLAEPTGEIMAEESNLTQDDLSFTADDASQGEEPAEDSVADLDFNLFASSGEGSTGESADFNLFAEPTDNSLIGDAGLDLFADPSEISEIEEASVDLFADTSEESGLDTVDLNLFADTVDNSLTESGGFDLFADSPSGLETEEPGMDLFTDTSEESGLDAADLNLFVDAMDDALAGEAEGNLFTDTSDTSGAEEPGFDLFADTPEESDLEAAELNLFADTTDSALTGEGGFNLFADSPEESAESPSLDLFAETPEALEDSPLGADFFAVTEETSDQAGFDLFAEPNISAESVTADSSLDDFFTTTSGSPITDSLGDLVSSGHESDEAGLFEEESLFSLDSVPDEEGMGAMAELFEENGSLDDNLFNLGELGDIGLESGDTSFFEEAETEIDPALQSVSALDEPSFSLEWEPANAETDSPFDEGDIENGQASDSLGFEFDLGTELNLDGETSGSVHDSLFEEEAELEFTASEITDFNADFDTSLDSLDLGNLTFDEVDMSSADAVEAIALDALLDSAPLIAEETGSDEFADLDALLGEEPATAPQSPRNTTSTDDFADLEALLDSSPPTPPPGSTTASDDFADLEALLGDTTPPSPPPVPAPSVPKPSNLADDFGDLEKLLEDADQTLGGSPTNRGVRGPAMANNRRAQRRAGGVLSEQTMRVSVKNLDNLNNLVGELVVNRNSLEQAEERLRQFLDNLLYQVQQLSDVGQRMRDLYERSLLESSLLSSRRSYHTIPAPSGSGNAASHGAHATGVSFDALEMDRFTGFHTLSQEMIELIVRVRESSSDIEFVVDETDQVTRNFRQITTQLQESLTRSRMVPFAQTADRLPRAVRDIAVKCGKQAELIVEGRETLIDKMILEQLYDPMTHLVNNAITHGIETSEERQQAGKPPMGRITIRTFHQGNQTVISVSDDGAGIDPERVKRKATEKGLITTEQAREMSRLDVYDLLFHHGFSTRDKADDFAGRGVGMDVVRTSLNEIRGVINIDSTVGRGTTFTIRLPLTLSISKALCCISNRARIAFPMDGVEDMLDVPKERLLKDDQGRSCIQWRDALLPFQPLSDLLVYNRSLGRGSVYGGNQEEDIISVVILRSAGNYLAVQVDQVLGEQEIVIKQLEGPVPKPVGVAGATVLGDGRIMPIADVLELIDLSMGRIRREAGSSLWEKDDDQIPAEPIDVKTEPTVLIVDDSITVRELLSMTFNKVGYRVEQARDGQEAWEKLRSGLPCDLVFCDIEMPRMDGLELLSRIQKDGSLSHLPIAMLTSRGADRHRQMAIQLGAKGYFTKPYLEEALLDAAQRMLNGEVLVSG